MKVTEHLDRAERPLISFEIIPPRRGGDLKGLLSLIEDLVVYEPPFIDITSHSAEVVYRETPDGIEKKVTRKRPGTLGVCALIQNKWNIDAVPHVLCKGFTREETEDFLIELRYLGIDNILAIRGDDNGYRKKLAHGRSANTYAADLIAQVNGMNKGSYIEAVYDAHSSDFCVGAACYPEKHFEAPNLELDIRYTKAKVDAGAEYLVTQMFFDNEKYFSFVERCRSAGITVPIIPGLKILTTKKHLTRIPRTFHCDLPVALAEELGATKDAAQAREVGVRWALKQAEGLLAAGVPSLHFYVMQSSRAINDLMAMLKPNL